MEREILSVLFIGGVFAQENETEIINNTKGYAEFSANIFQKKLINGFIENGTDIDVISAPFIGAFPNKYKKSIFIGFENEQEKYNYVKFNNIWGYRNFSRAAAVKRKIKEFAKEEKSYDLILVYSAHEPFLEAAVYAKKFYPNAKICFVVPDLPQYMNLDANRTKAYDILKKIDIRRMNNSMKSVDSFVILTEAMKDMLSVGERPYIVAEGIIEELPQRGDPDDLKENSIKNVVYTGKLNLAFGIKDLVDEFCRLEDENYRLVLCGDGDAREYITEMAATDSRIEYKGQVSPDIAKEIVKNADALVNPRKNDSEYTKYSFPSKNIEYLISGKPVVAYMLDGMPKEYSEFIFEVNNEKPLRVAIEEALNRSVEKKRDAFYKYAEGNLLARQISNKILKMN